MFSFVWRPPFNFRSKIPRKENIYPMPYVTSYKNKPFILFPLIFWAISRFSKLSGRHWKWTPKQLPSLPEHNGRHQGGASNIILGFKLTLEYEKKSRFIWMRPPKREFSRFFSEKQRNKRNQLFQKKNATKDEKKNVYVSPRVNKVARFCYSI